jgi:hypothetical protein
MVKNPRFTIFYIIWGDPQYFEGSRLRKVYNRIANLSAVESEGRSPQSRPEDEKPRIAQLTGEVEQLKQQILEFKGQARQANEERNNDQYATYSAVMRLLQEELARSRVERETQAHRQLQGKMAEVEEEMSSIRRQMSRHATSQSGVRYISGPQPLSHPGIQGHRQLGSSPADQFPPHFDQFYARRSRISVRGGSPFSAFPSRLGPHVEFSRPPSRRRNPPLVPSYRPQGRRAATFPRPPWESRWEHEFFLDDSPSVYPSLELDREHDRRPIRRHIPSGGSGRVYEIDDISVGSEDFHDDFSSEYDDSVNDYPSRESSSRSSEGWEDVRWRR